MLADRDVEKTYSMPEFIAKLRRLADALESGTPFAIQVDGEKIEVPKDAVLSVEHEREDGSEELEFQLSWKTEVQSDEENEDEGDEQDKDEAEPAAEEANADEAEKNSAAA